MRASLHISPRISKHLALYLQTFQGVKKYFFIQCISIAVLPFSHPVPDDSILSIQVHHLKVVKHKFAK